MPVVTTYKIVLRGVRFRARVGASRSERDLPQDVIVDVTLTLPYETMPERDNVRDVFDYDGVARQHLASVDATTGALTLFLPSRAGVPMYKTFQIAISGTTVYAAVGGPSGGRLRAFEDSLGNMLWNTEADGDVQAVTVLGGLVYIGGHFDTLGGLRRGSIGAADATTGVVDPWLPRANGSLWSLYTSGSRVFAGGDFAAVTGSVHQGYAVFSDV